MHRGMNADCQSFEERVFLHLSGELEPAERERWDSHLEGCPRCRRERAEVAEILGLTRALAPPAQTAPARPGMPRRPAAAALRWTAAVVLLLTGAAAGMVFGRATAGDATLRAEVETLRTEVGQLQRQAALAALAEDSAGDRLMAVTRLEPDGADGRVLEALLHALEHDPSVNVRLAALDALRHRPDLDPARGRLVSLLQRASSPVLRLALIDLLVERDVREADGVLRRLADGEDDPTLRRRARWALRRLS